MISLQIFKHTGTLNNRGKINKMREKMIFVLGLANKDPMNVMEVLKTS